MKRRFATKLIAAMVILGPKVVLAKKSPQIKTIRIHKAGYLDGFPSGDARLQPQHYPIIEQIVAHLKKHPKVTLVIKGSVSLEKIQRGFCYVSPDYTYYSLSTPRADTQKVVGEEECERALGFARAVAVKNEIVKKGIDPKRIKMFTEVDTAKRPGGHGDNRAVGYWYLEVPEDTKFLDASEDLSTGDLILEVQMPTACEIRKAKWHKKCQEMKEKLKIKT